MGNSGVEQSLAGKGKSAPPAGQDEEVSSLLPPFFCTGVRSLVLRRASQLPARLVGQRNPSGAKLSDGWSMHVAVYVCLGPFWSIMAEHGRHMAQIGEQRHELGSAMQNKLMNRHVCIIKEV